MKTFHKVLLCLVTGLFALEYVSGFLLGYNPAFAAAFVLEVICWLSFLVGMIATLIVIVWSLFKKRACPQLLVGWIILLVFYVPIRNYRRLDPSVVGAITALNVAGSEQVVQEGRQLMETWKPDLEKQRLHEPNDPLPPSIQIKPQDIPPAIARLHPGWVLVTEDKVAIKKYGLGDFAGFYIFPSNQTSRGIKLRDGLYWVDDSM